jgi:hypothetical protein
MSDTPRTDANLAATDAYCKKFNDAAKSPWGVTMLCPDPAAPPSLAMLCRELERELAEAEAKLDDYVLQVGRLQGHRAADGVYAVLLREALDCNANRLDGDGQRCWCDTSLDSGLFQTTHQPWCLKARGAIVALATNPATPTSVVSGPQASVSLGQVPAPLGDDALTVAQHDLERFAPIDTHEGVRMEEDHIGGWVRYDDAAAAIEYWKSKRNFEREMRKSGAELTVLPKESGS